jgi:uncharacterized protein (DUF433 family)
MTYTNKTTFSFEVEVRNERQGGVDVQTMERGLRDRGITGYRVDRDGSGCTEITPAPMAFGDKAINYINRLCDAINDIGRIERGNHNKLVNKICGLHVHMGAAFLADGVDPDQFTEESLQYMTDTGEYLGALRGRRDAQREQRARLFADPFDVELVRDIVLRYFLNTTAINKILTPSRRDNRYTWPLTKYGRLSVEQINACNDVQELNQLVSSIEHKYTSVNLVPYARLGTIEFRQHQGTTDADKIIKWCELLNNFILHSAENRLEQGTATTTEATPEALPVRRGSRIAVQYDLMRTEQGATITEIMDATGCGENRVRSAVTEIRQRIGQSAVVTHTQQANGASYGDGTHHARYQVLPEVTVQGSGIQLKPENRRGGTSIWCGVSDERFEWWQQRAIEIEEAEERRRRRR